MTENEQIQEITKVLCADYGDCEGCPFKYYSTCNPKEAAERIVTEKGYRKASEVAREIFEEIDKRFDSLLKFYPCNGEFEDAKKFVDFHWKYIKTSIMSDYKEGEK